jgi:hypothetical protein
MTDENMLPQDCGNWESFFSLREKKQTKKETRDEKWEVRVLSTVYLEKIIIPQAIKKHVDDDIKHLFYILKTFCLEFFTYDGCTVWYKSFVKNLTAGTSRSGSLVAPASYL